MNPSRILLAFVFLTVVTPHRVSGEVEELPASKMVVLKGLTKAARKLAWHQDGRLTSVDFEGNLAVWDAVKGQMLISKSILGKNGYPRDFCLYSGGTRFCIAFNSEVLTGSLPLIEMDRVPLKTFDGNPLWFASVSEDGKWGAVVGRPKRVSVVALDDKRVVSQMDPAEGVADVQFLPDGRLAVASETGKRVEIYVVGQSEPVLRLPFSVRQDELVVSPDGSMLAGGQTEYPEVCDIKDGAKPVKLRTSPAFVDDIAWTADGSMLATADTTGHVKLWDPRTGEIKKQLTLSQGQCSCIAFSPDGKWMAVGSGYHTNLDRNPLYPMNGDNSIRLLQVNWAPRKGPANDSRSWTSRGGKKIEATFVKLLGKDVVLQMADGKEYSVPRDRLSEVDNAFVTELLKKDTTLMARSLVDSVLDGMTDKLAAPQNYRFNVGWSKSQVSVAPKKVAQGYEGKVTTWTPKFKVTNNSGKDLAGLTMIYQVQIKLDRDKSQDDYAFPTGSKPLPLIKNNQTIEVEGKNFETLSAKLQSGYITKDRSRANKSDDVMGVVVKILHVNKLVHEYKSGTGVQDKLGEKLTGMGIEKGK